MADVVGSLLVRLGLDSGAFRSGMDVTEKEFRATQKRFENIGKKIASVGKTMTVGITAPLAAIGAAGAAAAGQLAKSVPELERLAQISGTGFEEFQRLAYAAKSVGFEADKMGDILKDTLDKVGDFQSTGGGAMADFFENIAPKVGITADAFKNLSGADALQLYYSSLEKAGVSQSEMTFYMEALASDATALAPLLRDNGKAMAEMGEKAAVIGSGDIASMKAYNEAQRQMSEAFKSLTIAVVNSGVLDAITGFVTKVADFASRLSKTNPELLQFAIGFGAVLAAVGPVITAFGGLVQIMAPLLAKASLGGLAAAIGPALPVVAALGAAGAVVYANWDKIVPVMQEVWKALSETLGPPLQQIVSTITSMLTELWNGPLGDLARGAITVLGEVGAAMLKVFGPVVLGAIKLILQAVGNALTALLEFGRAIGSLFRGDVTGAFQHLGSAINSLFGGLPAKVIGWISQMVQGIGQWMGAKLNAIWNNVKSKIDAVTGWFKDMYVAVVGNSYVPDMVTEIGQHMRRLDQELVAQARKATQSAAEAFRELQQEVADILARLFPEQAARITFDKERAALDAYHAAGKMSAEAHAEAVRALNREYAGLHRDILGTAIGGEAEQVQITGGGETIEQMSAKISSRFEEAMRIMQDRAEITKVQVVKSFGEMAEGAMNAVQRLVNAFKGGSFLDKVNAVVGVVSQVAGAFGGGGGFGGFRAEGGPVSTGRSYVVGERGPELFTPRSAGKITPNNELGGGRVAVTINPSKYFDAEVAGVASVVVNQAAPNIAAAGAAGGEARMHRRASRRFA